MAVATGSEEKVVQLLLQSASHFGARREKISSMALTPSFFSDPIETEIFM